MKLAQRCKVRPFNLFLPHGKELSFTNVQDHKLSGRVLRKLPVLAYATYNSAFTQGATPGMEGDKAGTMVETWLDAMEKIVEDKRLERENMGL